MTVEENVPLAPRTTFRVGGLARYFVRATTESDLAEGLRWARAQNISVAILGGGSNLLVSDAGFPGLVLQPALRGLQQAEDIFDVAAGEPWDDFVDAAGEAGCGGVECLAGIPGTVGASPVQNIGAYGQEVAQTIVSVRALDRDTAEFVDLRAEDCGFRYRRSMFNGPGQGRYIISGVRFRLRAGAAPNLTYADLQRWFAAAPGRASLAEVASAVRAIRRSKGMVLDKEDPDTWSAGSYFKNPAVNVDAISPIARAAAVSEEEVPRWAAGEGSVKLSAAWLLERAGFRKGFREGAVGLSTKHALALTNRGGATCADVLRLEDTIRRGVQTQFGLTLEREPVFLS